MQRIAKDFKVDGATRVKLAKNILMNTSRPQLDQGKYNAPKNRELLFTTS
ncbi:hypothetical protein OVA29_01980 [Exiguobacterium sp. SL14]|nr:hypothetical protein [Exiguobacterium sp. SL14]MCY1689742.1 hypothetical protein [Exiguobacterium sp. SL14]